MKNSKTHHLTIKQSKKKKIRSERDKRKDKKKSGAKNQKKAKGTHKQNDRSKTDVRQQMEYETGTQTNSKNSKFQKKTKKFQFDKYLLR